MGHNFFLLLWSLGFLAKIFIGKFKKGHKKNWTNFLIQIVSTILSSSNLGIFSKALFSNKNLWMASFFVHFKDTPESQYMKYNLYFMYIQFNQFTKINFKSDNLANE